MSNSESREVDLIKDPGLPAHVHRRTDTDPVAAKRAERQVAILFSLSALGTLLLIFSFIFISDETFIFIPVMGETNAHQLGLGLGMAIALFCIGAGAIHWAKTLMPDEEIVVQRHEFRSDDEDRADFVKTVKEGAANAGLGRRPLIKRTLGAALGLSGLTPLLLLRDLGPLPGDDLKKTHWKAGTRLVTDPGDRPLRPEDLEVGAVAQTLPELPAGEDHRSLADIGKDAVLLIRLRPEEFNLDAERLPGHMKASSLSQRFVLTWVALLLSTSSRPSTFSAHATNQHSMSRELQKLSLAPLRDLCHNWQSQWMPKAIS
ncbi:MAG: hypothetical protein RLZ24_569 [Actinomycetota bacterium]